MTILGIDIGGVEDIDPYLSLVDGPRATAQSVMVSLLHNPGVLWWAPERGYNLRSLLHTDVNVQQLIVAVRQQAELDERVESAVVEAEVFGRDLQIQVELTLTQDETAVSFTLTIDQLGAVLDASLA